MKWLTLSWLLYVLPALCVADPVRVFAAASLKGPLDQVVAEYESATGTTVRVAYGASSTLARQIQLGAPADLFWSANARWMDTLIGSGHVGQATVPLGNQLVLAGTGDALQIGALCDINRIATARVSSVPLGLYAQAALKAQGRWPLPPGCLIQTDNARAATVLVTRGEAAAGLLYHSDALQSGLNVWETIPTPEPIAYPLAAMTSAGAPLLDFLIQSTQPFQRAGFLTHVE